MTRPGICFLSGNMLKIIAAAAMLADHVGYLLFPNCDILRIIGRLAFPIFAFMIAEGCRYTKNKVRYFAMIFSLAAVCQIVYYIADGSLYMCILVTFSLSILSVFALDNAKRLYFGKDVSLLAKILSVALFVLCVVASYLLNTVFEIDYGFWGSMVPVAVSLFRMPKSCSVEFLKKMDNHAVSLACMAACMFPLAIETGWVQPYSFLALIPLLLYSGKRGKLRMKYFFYIFYPLHLVILQGIDILMSL